jgi:hypothetical protein
MNGLLKVPDYMEPYLQQLIAIETERATFLSRPSVMLGVVPKLDGNRWCALLGSNLMDGIAGLGDSPNEAMWAFDKAWYEKEKP